MFLGAGGDICRISDKVKQYAIDGVVLTVLKFCDQQMHDTPYLLRRLNEDSTLVI